MSRMVLKFTSIGYATVQIFNLSQKKKKNKNGVLQLESIFPDSTLDWTEGLLCSLGIIHCGLEM